MDLLRAGIFCALRSTASSWVQCAVGCQPHKAVVFNCWGRTGWAASSHSPQVAVLPSPTPPSSSVTARVWRSNPGNQGCRKTGGKQAAMQPVGVRVCRQAGRQGPSTLRDSQHGPWGAPLLQGHLPQLGMHWCGKEWWRGKACCFP